MLQEEYEDEEVEMLDEEETDPDFTPGDAEDDEDEDAGSLEPEEAQLDEFSDTNAPYAEEAKSSKQGA